MVDISSQKEALASGFRKVRPKGTPEPAFSTHKARAAWFRSREAWPVREAPTGILIGERARVRAELADQPGAAQWEAAGPTNIGGRMTSVVCHPQNPDVIWAGAAGGGVWKSLDAGLSWMPLWHQEATLNVGALALDPVDPEVVYCGTGEANLSADSHPGVGLYRSLDGGRYWQILAPSATTGIPTRIGAIAVDPFDSNHIRIGGVGFSSSRPGGLYVSRDGGVSWARERFSGTANYWCHAVVFHPDQRDTLYATVTALGMMNGIWRSHDGGRNWTHLTGGLPAAASMGRTSLAIAPSDPNILFAIADDTLGGVRGVFRSDDGGDNWREVGGKHFRQERQMFYNNTIAIHPTKPGHVLCGGVDLHLSRNGGRSWKQVTFWFKNRGESDYAHADHHCVLMPSARPGWVYDMNDGGMDFSEDGGRSWTNRSTGLAVTMYYDLDVSQQDGAMYGGGTQDNGTNITVTGGADDHFEILGGDGGWMTIDPSNSLHLYASSQRMRIFRFRTSDRWQEVSPLPASSSERQSMWMVFIAMDPNDPNTVFTGTQRVWRTRDDGGNWSPVSPPLDGSDITAIEIARNDSRRIYVGTENGGFFRSTDGGDNWSANLASTVLPGRTITRIRASADDSGTVFVTVANFGNRHVFRSGDGGLSWEDVDGGQLPDVPHHGIALPANHPRTVYVSNDAGVFVSTDLGGTWRNITRNLPNTMVVDLVYQQNDKTLTAATYGRSLWRLKTG